MNEDEKKMGETASYFVSICYAPWFLKFSLSQKVSANDLEAIKTSFTISESYWNLGESFILGMQWYAWHLTQELIWFSTADDDIED